MKIRLLGVMVAVALVAPGSDASAAVTDEARPLLPSLSPTAGTVHGGMTLAKAKKRRRPAGGGGGKAEPADEAAADDDGAGKSPSAASDAGDDAKEEEIFGKKKAAPRDDGASADSGEAKQAPKASKTSDKSVETVESQASEESETPSSASALEFGLGAKALFRNLAWTSDARAPGCSPCFGPYSLTPGPETAAWFEFYPAAFGTSGFAANVGLIGRFDYGFGVATTLADNTTVVKTTFRDFLAGIKVRIPFGTFIPNVSLAYGQQVFAIARSGDPSRDIPQVAYSFIRPALGARVMLAPTISLDAVLGYLMVLDPGSGTNYIKSQFPDAKAAGFDLSASVAFRLTGAIGLRGGFDFRQYAIALYDKTAPTIAGAVDRYITAWAGLEVVLDGAGAAAGDDDEPAKPSKRKRRRAPEPKEDEESADESKSEDE
jgi:hypothetical protein